MSRSEFSKLICKRALFLVKHLMLPVYAMEGSCREHTLRMLIADDGSTLPYISHLVFPNGASVKKIGRINALSAANLVENNADVVVVGANHLLLGEYASRGFHLVPKWVCPLFSMPEGLDTAIENISYSARKDIRRNIRIALDKGFTYEVTSDPAWFEMFYHDVYMRYGMGKYGDLAQIDSYSRVKDSYSKGIGLIITLDGKPVIGTVVLREGTTLRARYMGVYPDQDNASTTGSPTAMYYFTMKLAHSLGCTAVNLGSTRPFLSDGVLKFKMKWEPKMLHDELSTAVFAIAAPGLTEPATAFLAANPFFEMIGDDIVLHKPQSR
ncbi:MAG: hypothetical protein ABFD46_05440 [Armatimonadota bacterium]